MNEENRYQVCLDYFDGDSLAASTFISKYAMENEMTPDDMHHRMAKEYARIEEKFGGEHQLTEDDIYSLFEHFKYIIPGGSVMSNLGNNNVIGSLSNCYVVGQPSDTYASINKYRDFMVELEKRRGGVGIDLSKLRPRNSKVNNAAKTSTGPVSFMHVFSELSKEVAQGGRRGALMISISGNHPDVFSYEKDVDDFLSCKQDLTKITGANISVKFSDEFMNAVENNTEYYLRWPVNMEIIDVPNLKLGETWYFTDGSCIKRVMARDVWNKFVHCAWNTAEPGIMYEDKHCDLSPDSVYDEYKGVTTNPCVAGDTLIMTNKGQIKVSELLDRFSNGEAFLALTYNTENGSYSFEKITSVIKTRENAEIMGINTFGGLPMLKLTPNHKVYIQNKGYVEAKDVESADELVTISTQHPGIECIHKHKGDSFFDFPNEDVYDITVENNHNFFANGILVHNCGEIYMGKYDSCRLMHLNLPSFVKEDKTFDYELLEKVAYQNMMLCDDLVELELEHVNRIIEHIKSTYIEDNRNELELWEKIYNTGKSSRRAGCGATGIADAIALMGLKLNSEEGFNTVEKIFQVKMLGELKAQIDMAKERGTFVGYDFNLEFKPTFSSVHKDLHSLYKGRNGFFERLLDLPGFTDEMMFNMVKYGRRNVSWSTMAPVGTGAIMTQGTSGVEPVFKALYKRRKKVSLPTDRVDYVDDTGEKFTEFFVIHRPFKKWVKDTYGIDVHEYMKYEELEKYFKESPWYGCEAGDLTPEEHVRLQSTVQKYITHSLSKTCNLPNTASEQDISDIYMLGWKENCKGLTVYRDGCRSGVLISKEEKKDCNCKCQSTLTHSAPKRPKNLPCDVKRFRNGGDKWVACVGLYNGQPYEIFTGLAEKLNLPDYITKCAIIKNKIEQEVVDEETGTKEMKKVSRYDLVYSDKNGDIQMIENIGGLFRSEFYNVSKMTSGLLRHGMPIEYVISMIKSLDFKDKTVNSWKAGVIRTLKCYLKDVDETTDVCPECGEKLVRNNGCISCPNCGWSKCG